MQQEQQVRVDLTQTTPITCECGSNIFQEVLMLRRWSRFVSNLPTDQNIPIGVMACIKCKTIHEESLPPVVKALIDKEKEND